MAEIKNLFFFLHRIEYNSTIKVRILTAVRLQYIYYMQGTETFNFPANRERSQNLANILSWVSQGYNVMLI